MYLYFAFILGLTAIQHGCPPFISPLLCTVLTLILFAVHSMSRAHAHEQVQAISALKILSSFANLPVEVVEEILGHLDPQQVYAMRSCSSVLHLLATSRALWLSFLDVQRAEAGSSTTFLELPQGMHPCQAWHQRHVRLLNLESGLESWMTKPKSYSMIRQYGTLTMPDTPDANFEPGPTCMLPMFMGPVIELCHALSKVSWPCCV